MKFEKLWFIISICLFVMLLGVITRFNYSKHYDISVGEEAVTLLYVFNSPDDIDNNMKKLSKITTKDVFDVLTVNQSDRVMQVWLKFKGDPCNIEIVQAKNDYIIYHLLNKNIDSTRLFILSYEVNFFGKINNVSEGEVVTFPSSNMMW